jgi:hypothetical protein
MRDVLIGGGRFSATAVDLFEKWLYEKCIRADEMAESAIAKDGAPRMPENRNTSPFPFTAKAKRKGTHPNL